MRLGNGWPNPEQKLLLEACLLSGLEAQQAWKNWLGRIDIENLEPASLKLLPLAYRNPSIQKMKGPILDRCRGYYRKTWLENQVNWKKIKSSLDLLVENGIQVILLKGMAMILAHYKDFGVRPIGDIDILVSRKDLSAVQTIFQQIGMRQSDPRLNLQNKEQISRWHAISFWDKDGGDIDLHWSFIHEHSPFLDQAVILGAIPVASYFIPSPTHLFLQTCIHGSKHSPIPLIRWVADSMTLLKHCSLDWEKLIYLVKESHITFSMIQALEYLIEEFNASVPSWVLSSLRSGAIHTLEIREHKAYSKGSTYWAGWYRFCINQRLWKKGKQILYIHKYLQITARLKSAWMIPFFTVLWICRRIYHYHITSKT